MDTKAFTRKMKDLVTEETKIRKRVIALIREIHRRELWKRQGYKSLGEYCQKSLRYDEIETREILIELGVILTQSQMTDPAPTVQNRIDSLKLWRKEKASKLESAPYLIFSNRTLMTIARENPKSIEQLAQIPGMGAKRIETYGKEVMERLRT